jgi:outer membrane protein assembly factor BamB
LVLSTACWAVSSKVVRHTSSSDLLKGQIEDVVIGSRGTIQLGRAAETLLEEAEDIGDVWSINSIVVSGGTVYFGTSPNGGIYKYSLNRLAKIYPKEENRNLPEEEPGDANEPDGEKVEAEEHLTNEHIFAMATDVSGRLLAGISGKNCRLCRFDGDKMEIIFEPDDAKYIFAITVDGGGNIYLGTGPEGKVYRLNSLGRRAKLIYDSLDKNILSLVSGTDGFIYAGSDSRGLVYKINPRTEKATVLYDSEQPEITALLFMDEPVSLYAAATSAKIVQAQTQFAAKQPSAGRPEEDAEEDDEGEDTRQSEGGRELKIANTKRPAGAKPRQGPPQVRKVAKPGQASYIYKVTKDGFVTTVFGESVVFFCLSQEDGKLLAGTGNSAQLFSIDPAAEQEAVIYEDKQASQITAIAVAGENVYLGMANPAKLIKLGFGFTSQGTYISDLVDAGQPAKWGKLQLEADIPKGCKIRVASRSGNVKDVNDPTFSQWTEPVEILEPVQLECPLGRFCQYKLILESEDGDVSPLVREIAVASTVPNLAPKVESVAVERIAKAGKEGIFNISYRTTDDNGDKLAYKIDFRKLGRTNWIELEDETDKPNFEWSGKTVEDGRYEVRVTASDAKSNTTSTMLSGSRISEPVIVDNTGPAVMNITTSSRGRQYKIFEIKVQDELSAISKLEYTIDSNADWTGTVPDDLVYDTTEEDFTIQVETNKDLSEGDHVLTIRVSDAVGNTTYKTFDVNI